LESENVVIIIISHDELQGVDLWEFAATSRDFLVQAEALEPGLAKESILGPF